MFTGIIEEIGKVKDVLQSQQGVTMTISAKLVLKGMQIGNSIAVNGACLTVIQNNDMEFRVELSLETLARTTFKGIKRGEYINLERPLQMNDRLGGHLVSGHIDGIGQLVEKIQKNNTVFMKFSVPFEFCKYLISKGSIAIDGISLTVVNIQGNRFTVSIIPHTLNMTTLKSKKKGDLVNMEYDLVAKYIEKFYQHHPKTQSINLDFLQIHGYR